MLVFQETSGVNEKTPGLSYHQSQRQFHGMPFDAAQPAYVRITYYDHDAKQDRFGNYYGQTALISILPETLDAFNRENAEVIYELFSKKIIEVAPSSNKPKLVDVYFGPAIDQFGNPVNGAPYHFAMSVKPTQRSQSQEFRTFNKPSGCEVNSPSMN